MQENDIQKALAIIEHAAAKCGFNLTLHMLKTVRQVLKLELAGNREKALEVLKRNLPDEED
jgi:hypothetical protein